MNRAFVFIGSNIDREKNYVEALRRLRKLGAVVRVSSVYETPPLGGREGENFYNGAALLETPLEAHELKQQLRRIEAELGRVRSLDRYAPRKIDLDLVLFNQERIEDRSLQVPDPHIVERPFMLLALAELDPNYVHPLAQRSLAELARQSAGRASGLRLEPVMTAYVKRRFNHTFTGEVSHA